MENKNIAAVLDLLSDTLLQHDYLPQVYLESRPNTGDTDSPLSGASLPDTPATLLRPKEAKLPYFLHQLGIRSMTIDDPGNIDTLLTAASEIDSTIKGATINYFRNPAYIEHIRAIMQHCSTIAFTDWASYAGASDSWDSLLREVIKPLKKRDMEFIFYLGNISSSPVFKVDEALDIMSDYSRYGRTTFALDQQEMKSLWQQLNGVKTNKNDDSWPFDYEEKFRFLFNTMKVQILMVYSPNGVSVYSQDQRFNLSREILPAHIENSSHARTDFINGYTMGLTLKLDISLCTALGIVYYAACGQYKAKPDRKALLDYIAAWRKKSGNTTS
ncbi:MAG TPA: hypothetical protein VI233_18050 [Puia sp.]